jgi:lipopolysaccharide transport system ATP-binding protein
VEAICDRVIWLDGGEIQAIGEPAKAIVAYNALLSKMSSSGVNDASTPQAAEVIRAPTGVAYIKSVTVQSDGLVGKDLIAHSRKSLVQIKLDFMTDVGLPPPSVAVLITDSQGRDIASAGTVNDGMQLHISANGEGSAELSYEKFPLLKGVYWVNVLLMCEKGIHIYEPAEKVAKITVHQSDMEVGIVSLPHAWVDTCKFQE